MAQKRKKAVKKSQRARLGLPDLSSLNDDFNEDNFRESFFRSDDDNSRNSTLDSRFQAIFNFPLFRTRKGVAIVSAIVSAILTLGLSSLFASNPLDTTTLAARISGGVALSEPELKDVVKKLGETVYWAGPMKGAKYTINAQNVGAIYVRYLPDGKGISDNSPIYRVVATYKEANGYDATLAAGNQPNGVSLFRSDNTGVLYYNKNTPTNVYLAFKTQPYQIEVFDPSAEISLAIANDANAVQTIK
jgi:hypothetical protein